MKITSAGIIRNEDKPRVGVTQANRLHSSIFDVIDDGIDLAWEEFSAELDAKVAAIDADTELSDPEREDALEDVDNERECADVVRGTMLFGAAWTKGADGKYSVDPSKGGYAACYSADSGCITVEWSVFTTECHHTSPCYVMADGSGPCGDLDTPGNSVVAYTLPPEFFKRECEDCGESFSPLVNALGDETTRCEDCQQD